MFKIIAANTVDRNSEPKSILKRIENTLYQQQSTQVEKGIKRLRFKRDLEEVKEISPRISKRQRIENAISIPDNASEELVQFILSTSNNLFNEIKDKNDSNLHQYTDTILRGLGRCKSSTKSDFLSLMAKLCYILNHIDDGLC